MLRDRGGLAAIAQRGFSLTEVAITIVIIAILVATGIGVWWLGEAWPQGPALGGAVVVIGGIVAFSLVAAHAAAGDRRATAQLRTDRGA